jgi:phage/plasmid primase, P4 family, C-terminal domain
MVTISEPEEGVRINESLVKQLTGDDTVTARFLYGDDFEYIPKYKIWISTNHKPVIHGTDNGIWRRVVMIPFRLKLKPEEIDRQLQYKLRQELPQIAKWCVDGCMMWQQEGLEKPEAVQEATNAYRSEMDVLANFVADCVESTEDEGAAIKAADVYAIYQAWAEDTNSYEYTAAKFGQAFGKRFSHKIRRGDGMYYKYCRLNDFAQSNYASKKNYPQIKIIK